MEDNKSRELQEIGEAPETEAADQKPMSEVEMRRAQLEETQRSVQKAKEEIASSRQRASEASKEIASARKAIIEQKKRVRKAERDEKKQKRQEAVTRSKEEMQQELERRKQALVHTKAELSDKMKKLLSGDIKAMNKWKKTRAAEILAVFAKHNFYAGGLTPVELRTTLEDLGPTYVKIGQIMSSRVDMLPVSYCKELEKLRQNVKELDPEIAKAVIEQETGKKIDELFLEFRDKPLGSASIGQAHLAVLKDGTKVVTKVQRPLIAEMMREDFVLLKKLATAVNVVKEADEDSEQMVDLLSVIEELEKVENEELDFRVEAENTRFFKENCSEDEEKITCPTVIDELNIMVSHGKPVWIDFGMIGRISDADVNIIQSLILSLIERDLDKLVNAIMSMGAASPQTNRGKLMEDADMMFDKYMNVTNLQELDLSSLLDEVMTLADKHHISLPGKYTMLVRSIATIEGVIEQLCPELNLFQQITDKLMERVKQTIDVEQKLLAAGKDALDIGKKVSRMPGLAYDALNNMVKGRTKISFELTGYEDVLKSLNTTVKNIVFALFSCVLFIGSCILSSVDMQPKTPTGQPVVAAVGMVISVALGIYTIKRMSKKK